MSKSRGIVSTDDFLSQIDSSLSQHTALLMNKGFSNTRTLAHLSISDIPEIPFGLRRLLIHEVSKLCSPLTRPLLNHKDSSVDSLHVFSGVSTVPSNSPIVISDDPVSRSTILRPKQLFPSRNTGDSSVTCPDPKYVDFSAYEYQSPMEKHLTTVLTEISEKEIEIEKIKSDIESMKPTDYSDGDTVAITCGRCHQGNHTKRRCVDPPCTTSISCGKIKFHKSELKVVENKKVQLKKLICDKVSLEAESKKIRETITTTVKTFPQAIKTALINSNKKEYLTIHDSKFVPLTTRINRDISILQKYYNGIIPSDLEQESSLFQTIIAEANKRFQINSYTVEQKLEETLSSVHSRITSYTCSGSATQSNCITVDSSPEINSDPRITTIVSITSPPSSVGHEMLPNNQNSTLNSPPTKLPKSSTNVSWHDSGLDQFVTNFEKLHSPSKHMSNPIDNHNSAVTTSACTTPVSMSTSKVNVPVYSSPLKTPYADTSSHKTASRNGSSRSPSTKSTDKPIIDHV